MLEETQREDLYDLAIDKEVVGDQNIAPTEEELRTLVAEAQRERSALLDNRSNRRVLNALNTLNETLKSRLDKIIQLIDENKKD